ncbi:MAG: LPS assembly lipoprotein LptE [Sedimenticola sp.]|nr:LPS assembly lipoprotein LptE [Sedimenticola sp.]
MIGIQSRHLALLIIAVSLLLQGCGFQLRGSTNLPSTIGPLYIQGVGEYEILGRELSQMIAFSDIEVVKNAQAATSVLNITKRASDRRVISVDGNGNVAEYELHEAANFSLTDRQGKALVKDQQVSITGTYLNSETEVLGKQREEGELRKEMQRDLAAQIMRRLQAQL